MNGLADYLAGKVEDSPLLWNVSVVNVYADTSDVLTRSSEYNVSLKIGSSEDGLNTHINVEISKEYIDDKMISMLLVFAVTFAVALIMIFELLKLPDALFTRISRNFRGSPGDTGWGGGSGAEAGFVHSLYRNVRRHTVLKCAYNAVEQVDIRAFGHVPGLDTDDRRASRDYAVLAASAPGLPTHEPETGVRGLHAYLSGRRIFCASSLPRRSSSSY